MRPADGDGLRVLIVEDEPMLLELLADEFIAAGLDISTAKTGEEAVEAIEGAARLDALLADICLPGTMTGWVVAEHFRREWPKGVVLYATAYSDVEPRRVPGGL